VDPAWYKFTFSTDLWLSDGTKNLRDPPYSGMYLGHYDVERAIGYENTTSWQNSDKIWGPEENNLTFVLTTTDSRARLEHLWEANRFINMSYELNVGGSSQVLTQTNSVIEHVPLGYYLGSNVHISVTNPTNQHGLYKGHYTSYLTLQIYAEYGTSNEILLTEYTFDVYVYYMEESVPVITNLTVDRYSSAENIDVTSLQQNGGYLNVGSVEFTSNHTKSNGNYVLIISPKNNPFSGDFVFEHVTFPSSFTYRVFVPGRTTPSYKQFRVPVTEPIGNATWSDFLEIAITGINAQNISYLVGEYTSTIVIELAYE
jgi:hypothetical protein